MMFLIFNLSKINILSSNLSIYITLYIARLTIFIESFSNDQCTNQPYDVTIIPKTTIKDLKDMVRINKIQQ